MKAIIHIGTEKTGTTTIQDFLVENSAGFESVGYYVIKSMGRGNNRSLASYAMEDTRLDNYYFNRGITSGEGKVKHDKGTLKKLHEELSGLPKNIHTVIFSSEHFHSRCIHKDEVEKLKSSIAGFFDQYEIVVYLRPQIDVSTSLYSTYLRSGGQREFESFLKADLDLDKPYYNYESLLNRWSEAFGADSISPRIFDKEKMHNNDLLEDFLMAIGCDENDNIIKVDANKNESLSTVGQELLRVVNISRESEYSMLDSNMRDVMVFVENNLTGRGCIPTRELAISLQAKFATINYNVARKWFNNEELFSIDYEKYSGPATPDEHVKLALLFLFSSFTKGAQHQYLLSRGDVNALRDSALKLESLDMSYALRLMRLAKRFRPNGPLIVKKVNEYMSKLDALKK